MSAFWIVDVRGPNQLGMLTAHFLCGAYLPIVFFPGWLEGLCRVLPFAYMVQVPIEIWLGQHTGTDLLVGPRDPAVLARRAGGARAARARHGRSIGWWCRVGSAIADLRVWRRLVGARIRADWQYRTSFFLFLLSQTLVACLDLAVIAAIFTQVDSLGGWSGVEVALLFGLSGVAFGLADLLISAVENASRHIKAGTFDLFLLRPLPPLMHLSASEFALRRVGRVIQPLVVLIGALVPRAHRLES